MTVATGGNLATTTGSITVGGNGAGTLNVTATGSVTLGAGNVTLASATQTGTLNVTRGGAVSIPGSVPDGRAARTINATNGSLTIGTGLTMDTLSVASTNAAAAAQGTITVSAGAVTIGTGTQDLLIGRRITAAATSTTTATTGTLDLSNASGVTINVNN